ncbi:hypothetical protein [Arthrobacter phage SWEP2]|uniref:Uncharacterized protein n=1 Tax=Arthrobacter phage SWEP2 TaxID=2945958 RepID=A0A9E7MIW0_9CAUD|nr:hypothetical protein [Arthrobacter phage SWEP2]
MIAIVTGWIAGALSAELVFLVWYRIQDWRFRRFYGEAD